MRSTGLLEVTIEYVEFEESLQRLGLSDEQLLINGCFQLHRRMVQNSIDDSLAQLIGMAVIVLAVSRGFARFANLLLPD
jgi:hypothetical protein